MITRLLISFLLTVVLISAHGYSKDTAYENLQTKELSTNEFNNLLFKFINDLRTSRGLLPLVLDDIAARVANEHLDEINLKETVSYFNSMQQGPDERYTLSGGTGAITEIIKAFENSESLPKIKPTNLLARHLVDAIKASPDDLQILFNPYINHFGCSFAISKDKKKFVSVLEFLTKAGEFEPIRSNLNWGEKLHIQGKVKLPFKFKAISVAYFDEIPYLEDEINYQSFTSEDLKPYFPPQDYIAFGSTAKSNVVNALKGLGIIGAIGAAPFTGGATAVFAPVLLSSIQNGPPREIPLKRGIKINSKGEFSGQVELNYQGMSGLYYISILAELPNVDFPIVISRRTVRVNSPLMQEG